MNPAATDIRLLRFLHARVDERAVLNPGGSAPRPRPAIAADLMRAAKYLLSGRDRADLPYGAIAASPEFAAFRALTGELHGFDPATLQGRRERTAFWINIFNALVIDAVISFDISDTIRESPGFFRRAAYQVGPYRFALDEIEHGLLRDNRPQHPRLPPPFAPGDPRGSLGPGLLDPRIHFALNCGTRSCPPVSFYEAALLDQQLDAAAASFINGEGVRMEGGALVLSPIFDFYVEDFGGREGVHGWLFRYLVDASARARLAESDARTGEYDWSLNRR